MHTDRTLSLILFLLISASQTAPAGSAADFVYDAGFLNPPASAKPQTWWHWREGRINKEAITAELEAMKQIGLSGATMFSTSRLGETGPNVPCLSPEWYDRVRFAIQECDRLGLKFSFQNCAGWSGAGGPWITPDKAMQHVVHSRYRVEGGKILRIEAPPSWPHSGSTHYRDIAVLAFPTPAAFKNPQILPSPSITSPDLQGDPAILKAPETTENVDGNTPSLRAESSNPVWVQFEFPHPVVCRAVTIAGTPELRLPDDHRAIVLASDDGKNFREIVRLSTYTVVWRYVNSSVTHAIPTTKARFFRLAWNGPVKLALRRIRWSAEPAIYSCESKTGKTGLTLVSEPHLPTEEGTATPLSHVLDLTRRIDAQGYFTWTAPAGDWTVVRIGSRSRERKVAPAPPEATGLECDKFDTKVVSFHFENYAAKILNNAATLKSKAVEAVIVDSWEADTQNWSPVFREEFRKRRGYDLLNYLPTFAGYIMEDRNVTDRFLRDVRQTMSDLVSENFFGKMRALANKNGLQMHAESCGGSGGGTMVADALQPFLHVDVPMSELNVPMKEASSAAHVSGKRVVAMEAFTQGGGVDWHSSPQTLKAGGDAAFCTGANRFVFHTYAHNPDLNELFPGATFGKYGLAFNRGQTWWEMGRAWITYLSRCQFLLQCGHAAADVLYFYGEEPGGTTPVVFGANRRNLDEWTALPKGYDFDLLPAEVLIKSLKVKNGNLVLPDGATYRLLVLRDSDLMTPEAALKIRDLVKRGAIVTGPKPKRSPSLTGYPRCDAVVRSVGEEVWGNCDGKAVMRNSFGKGHVFWGTSLKETLEAIPLIPDFSTGNPGLGSVIRFIHRRDGDFDAYFIANTRQEPLNFDAEFRVTGRRPEIWDPITGSIRNASSFRQQDGRTILPLQFDPWGSLFVVFRRPIGKQVEGTAGRNFPLFTEAHVLNQPWSVRFAPGWGAPESITFTTLQDWSKRPEPGIRFYSGTATYEASFDWSGSTKDGVHLDLGAVSVIAGVKVNGIDCGIAWTRPYRVEITRALRSGQNHLEVRVANTWANRLMGEGRVEGATLRTWTTVPPRFKQDAQPFEAGLMGPVRLVIAKDNE